MNEKERPRWHFTVTILGCLLFAVLASLFVACIRVQSPKETSKLDSVIRANDTLNDALNSCQISLMDCSEKESAPDTCSCSKINQ